MTITRKEIQRMRSHGRMHIDAALEELILSEYGVEPEPFEYTAQDLHEQIRKLVYRYNREHHAPHIGEDSTPWPRDGSASPAPTTHRGDNTSKLSNT